LICFRIDKPDECDKGKIIDFIMCKSPVNTSQNAKDTIMDKKLLSVAEAFIKLNESLLRMVLAVNRAKLALEKVLRLKYRTAGYPFGENEEGFLLWRDYLSKKYVMQSLANGPVSFQDSTWCSQWQMIR